jgi:hypothetical protein
MVSGKTGEAGAPEVEAWARRVAATVDRAVAASAIFDPDSNTYVLRLQKGARVLLFRLSEAQVTADEREQECEKILRRKIKDLEG